MVDEVKLEGSGSLKDLLEAHSEHARSAIAIRAALRVLPVVFQELDERPSESYTSDFVLCCLRTAITAISTHNFESKDRNDREIAASECQLALMSASSEIVLAESHSAAQALSNALACVSASGTTALQLALDACEYSIRAFVLKQTRLYSEIDNTERNTPNALKDHLEEAETAIRANISLDFEPLEQLQSGSLSQKVLWSDPAKHGMMFSGWPNFAMADGPSWSFWQKWYLGIMDGLPVGMPMQLRISAIADSIWRQGPEAIAQAIREIERELAGPTPLEDAVLQKHVELLLKSPVLSEATALNGAETIERAIADYLREAPANCLPVDLKHLEALPQHFRAIAQLIGSKANEDQKESQLVDEISKLHARVTELEKELAVAKSKELKGIISQEAAKSFGKTIGSPLFWSGAAVSVGYFFGVAPSDMTLENFRNYVAELLRANAETVPTAQPPLSSGIDV